MASFPPQREHKLLTVTMRSLILLIMLVFSQLFFHLAHASPHATAKANQQNLDGKSVRDDDRRKRRPVKQITARKSKVPDTAPLHAKRKQARPLKAATAPLKPANTGRNKALTGKHKASKKAAARPHTKGRVRHAGTYDATAPLRLTKTQRARYMKARETAMSKLMGQLGKPYIRGGASPDSGFDCSGLVWYAYKDLVKFKIPRTANEMYQLRDAAVVKHSDLEKGDLVFFRIHDRGMADHVGVYLGNGKFIQSPSTGKDIQVSALADNYWRQHYIGARRVMTPGSVR